MDILEANIRSGLLNIELSFAIGRYYVYGYGYHPDGTPIESAYLDLDADGAIKAANFYSIGEAKFTTDLAGRTCNISKALDTLGRTGSWDSFVSEAVSIVCDYLKLSNS